MIEQETVNALIEAIEILGKARRRIATVMDGTENGTAGYDNLDRARRGVNHAEALIRSILDRGK